MIAAISPDDEKLLRLKFKNVFYVPVFHENIKVTSETGVGKFALYHGNLGVGENNEAALYLVKNYKHIMIPVFETQNMLRNKKYLS